MTSPAQRVPGAELVEFDAAHLSNVEQASALTDRVPVFLAARPLS
jgi:hypothetical protein